MNTPKDNSKGNGGQALKIVVIGGTGLIGKEVVRILQGKGHEVIVASPSTGVNILTGEGLAQALTGAQVVVDVTNSPSFEEKAVLEFFQTAGRNIHAAEAAAGVKHHVALSVVGTDRLQDSGYFRAKLAQEKLIKDSGIPFTIVRATQFFEFVASIAQSFINGDTIRATPEPFQPMAAAEVSAAVADAALAEPTNGISDVAGPERVSMASIVRTYLAAQGDKREVVDDVNAAYFGVKIDDKSLVPLGEAKLGRVRYEDWLAKSQPVGAK
nr:SDR family oxidoreductase [Roseimicrobium sp. ORNL1]